MRRLRPIPLLLALTALLLAAPADAGRRKVRRIAPMSLVTHGNCVIKILAEARDLVEDPDDPNDNGEIVQAEADVLAVKNRIETALMKSTDMQTKVTQACDMNGSTRFDGKKELLIRVFRDHPSIDVGEAVEAQSGNGGFINVDAGDTDAVGNHFAPGSDPGLVTVISRSYLTRVLAHEFDHLRDDPTSIMNRTGAHHDPSGRRALVMKGAPVDDANQVKSDIGSGDVRRSYASGQNGSQQAYDGGSVNPGKVALLNFADLINRNRKVKKKGSNGQGAGVGQTTMPNEILDALPGQPCLGTADPCWDYLGELDYDLDGVYDWDDNCPMLNNPQQADSNMSSVGDDCEFDPGENVCGNGLVEGAEQCDGTNDGVCPLHCLSDCTCFVP